MGSRRSRGRWAAAAAAAVVVVVVSVVLTITVRSRGGNEEISDSEARTVVVGALPDPSTVTGLSPQPTTDESLGERLGDGVLVQTGSQIKALVCSGTIGPTPAQARAARVQARETFTTAAAVTTIPGSTDPGTQALALSATQFTSDGIGAAMDSLAEQVRVCPSAAADPTRDFVAVPPGGPDPGPPRQQGDPTPAGVAVGGGIDLTVPDRIVWRGRVPASLAPRGSILQVTCVVDRVNLVVTRSCGAAGASSRADELATLGAGRLLDGLS